MNRTMLLAMPILAALAACGGVGGIGALSTDAAPEPPTASLADIGLAGTGVLEQSLDLQVRFTNPNAYALPVDGLKLDLELAGEPLGQGVSDERFSLPRLGEKTVSVVVRVGTGTLIDRLGGLGVTDKIAYRIAGELFIDRGVGRDSEPLPFAGESEIGLPRLGF